MEEESLVDNFKRAADAFFGNTLVRVVISLVLLEQVYSAIKDFGAGLMIGLRGGGF